MSYSLGQMLLLEHLKELKEPFEAEFKFDEKRKWRFDFAYPHHKLGLEVEGGVWVQGRHQRGKGFLADIEKYNSATVQGWHILRFATEQVMDGSAKELVKHFLLSKR